MGNAKCKMKNANHHTLPLHINRDCRGNAESLAGGTSLINVGAGFIPALVSEGMGNHKDYPYKTQNGALYRAIFILH